jgi:hypothetical protein
MADKSLTPPSLIRSWKTPDFHASPLLGNYFIHFYYQSLPFNTRVRWWRFPRWIKISSLTKSPAPERIARDQFQPPKTGRLHRTARL